MASISRIVADFSFFGRGYVRNAIGLFFGLIFPVILILIFGAIFSGGFGSGNSSSGPVVAYVQNFDHGVASTQFINATNSSSVIRLIPVGTSENFSSYLSAHSASDGIVIPANFTSSFMLGRNVNVTVFGNPSSSTSSVVTGVVGAVMNQFNLRRVGGSEVLGMVHTTVRGSSYTYVDFLVPGLIGYSVLISPMFSLVNISSLYKKIKLFKQFSLTPLTRGEWLVSKILWYIFLGVISFVLMIATGVFLFGAHVLLSIWLVPFLILGPMFFASLGMLIGTIAKSVETASVIGQVVTFPMMFLSGTFFPVSYMPQYLQSVAHALPLYYVIDGLNQVMIFNNANAALIDMAIVAVLAILVTFIAVRLFKWRED